MKQIYPIMLFSLPFVFSSCQVMKEAARDAAIESVKDTKSGAPVFVCEDANSPYEINVGGIAKVRKQARKEKFRKELDRY